MLETCFFFYMLFTCLKKFELDVAYLFFLFGYFCNKFVLLGGPTMVKLLKCVINLKLIEMIAGVIAVI